MKTTLASALGALVLMTIAACGVDVPAGLVDKVNSGCPDLLKPEPLAVITQGFEVSQVVSNVADSCKVSVREAGRDVLLVSLIAHPDQEAAERLTGGLCLSGGLDADKSCTASEAGSGTFSVHGVAGRWEVRIAVYEIPVNDEAKKAVHQILEDLRSSDRTK